MTLKSMRIHFSTPLAVGRLSGSHVDGTNLCHDCGSGSAAKRSVWLKRQLARRPL